MNLKTLLSIIILILFSASISQSKQKSVHQKIIDHSISQYNGSCPCPYNLASNGSRCGKRSAYSRPGGASPICYKSDVTPEMIKIFTKH